MLLRPFSNSQYQNDIIVERRNRSYVVNQKDFLGVTFHRRSRLDWPKLELLISVFLTEFE